MWELAAAGGSVIIISLLLWLWTKALVKVKEQELKLKHREALDALLKKQRDVDINSVADADKLWDSTDRK